MAKRERAFVGPHRPIWPKRSLMFNRHVCSPEVRLQAGIGLVASVLQLIRPSGKVMHMLRIYNLKINIGWKLSVIILICGQEPKISGNLIDTDKDRREHGMVSYTRAVNYAYRGEQFRCLFCGRGETPSTCTILYTVGRTSYRKARLSKVLKLIADLWPNLNRRD